jgi:tripartite ATP-independent transporter DctM subunit
MLESLAVPITLLLFAVFLAIEIPIAFSLMGAGLIGIVLLGFGTSAQSFMAAVPFTNVASYGLLIIPMFLLLGAVVSHSGIAARIFEAANRLIGWLPGGLAVSTILACTLFGAISGSSAADVATIGKVSLHQMRRHGYAPDDAAGVVAAGGTLAILIPPSIPLVMYGILTGVPIGDLLLAGVVPGLMTALAYIAWIVFVCRRHRDAAPPDAPAAGAQHRQARAANLPFIGLVYAALLVTIIIGGIYSGIFTSTEAAAMGALAALVIGIPVTMLEGNRVGPMLAGALGEAGSMTAMIFMLLVGSAIFGYFLTLSGVASDLAIWVVSFDLPPGWVVAICLLMLIPLGMFLDGMSMLLIVVPLMFPILSRMGVDPVWFGVLVVMLIEIGLLTPPFGINVFVIARIARDVPLEKVFISVLPFIAIQIVMVAIIFAFPQIVLFLPELARAGR